MAKYKVAVATNDGINVNVHFGHAAAFDIELSVEEAIAKINLYRNKLAQRALKQKDHQNG